MTPHLEVGGVAERRRVRRRTAAGENAQVDGGLPSSAGPRASSGKEQRGGEWRSPASRWSAEDALQRWRGELQGAQLGIGRDRWGERELGGELGQSLAEPAPARPRPGARVSRISARPRSDAVDSEASRAWDGQQVADRVGDPTRARASSGSRRFRMG